MTQFDYQISDQDIGRVLPITDAPRLFALLPEAEQQVAGQICQANRNSAMQETLAEGNC